MHICGANYDKSGKLHGDDRAPVLACPVGAPTVSSTGYSSSAQDDSSDTWLGWSDQPYRAIADGELVGQVFPYHVGDCLVGFESAERSQNLTVVDAALVASCDATDLCIDDHQAVVVGLDFKTGQLLLVGGLEMVDGHHGPNYHQYHHSRKPDLRGELHHEPLCRLFTLLVKVLE